MKRQRFITNEDGSVHIAIDKVVRIEVIRQTVCVVDTTGKATLIERYPKNSDALAAADELQDFINEHA